MPADLSRMAVMTTAWRRPYYFERILNSWSRAEGQDQLARFVISLGRTDRYQRQVKLIDRMRPRFGVPLEILEQSDRAMSVNGPHTAIAEAANLPPRVIQPPPLTADEIRHLLSECVTVVKPGETLILRVPWTTTPTQVRELQVVLDETTAWLELPFKALVVPGDELTVAQAPEPDFMARVTTEPLGGPEHLRGALTIRLTHEPTGVTVAARDRTEGVHKLRKALADRARRQYDLQEAERRQQRKEAGGAA